MGYVRLKTYLDLRRLHLAGRVDAKAYAAMSGFGLAQARQRLCQLRMEGLVSSTREGRTTHGVVRQWWVSEAQLEEARRRCPDALRVERLVEIGPCTAAQVRRTVAGMRNGPKWLRKRMDEGIIVERGMGQYFVPAAVAVLFI